ncbi:MAG: class I SAM-dependent methyltransferase [Chloroflexi bacterium AL-W]|nr:methyltransferase domain-containing protein [Chloroflexi bacterium AL-N1]NOK67378.1 class I SAM-dependent methyltransferase [Chloroflexi bacterium AL-N10]NOK75130.1 class I SAM-dependent methyltransferase [Chloroflexi bacterium AL-N5]NOK81917.1 class I SAM-dependent methyltransferase [Chloroflexi bacterium AL-W]NOK89763.1 class I SAM-dependent methyltransferase [Chloroflexi bacterium AL-N15]
MERKMFSENTLKQAETFDKIGDVYESAFGVNPAQVSATEWLIQNLPTNAQVLDVGCGAGVPTAQLIANAGFNVTGIDSSVEMLRLAQQKVPNGTFRLMDMTDLSLDGLMFQGMAAFFSLLMLPRADIVPTIRQLTRYLESESYVVISMVEGNFDYFTIPFLGHTINVSAYSAGEFADILNTENLHVIDVQTVDFSPNENADPETQAFYYCQYRP